MTSSEPPITVSTHSHLSSLLGLERSVRLLALLFHLPQPVSVVHLSRFVSVERRKIPPHHTLVGLRDLFATYQYTFEIEQIDEAVAETRVRELLCSLTSRV